MLLDEMPDDSGYRRARDGYPFGVERDWTRVEYLAARHVAEVAAGRGEFDPTGLVSPVEQAVSQMKAKGQWPPAWWSEHDRKIAAAEHAAERAAEPVNVEADREAASSMIARQLHRRS